MITVTVFTPTYNRAHLLPQLYNSLLNQTILDFEWLIVDDGSTDNTSSVIEQWLEDAPFTITYIKQANGGKHRAINNGLSHAKGLLFFTVDSDDALTENAIERICYHYEFIKDKPEFCGICGMKGFFSGGRVGGNENFNVIECNSLDIRYKHKIKGDLAEVFVTDILKEYKFPDIANEKFCAESLVFNRLSKKYLIHYFNEIIYLCDYLPDGLSKNSIKNRMKCPCYATTIYSELLTCHIPWTMRIKSAINYWRFWFCESPNKKERISPVYLILLPFGLTYHFFDLYHTRK